MTAYLSLRSRHPEDLAILGQPFGHWDMGQLFSLTSIDWLVFCGYFTCAEFDINHAPLNDRHRDINQQNLDHGLPCDIRATVDDLQRGAEQDGHLKWELPIAGKAVVDDGVRPQSILPRTVPLEIGYTDASSVLRHLVFDGAVARWPYRSNSLSILAAGDRKMPGKLRYGLVDIDDPILASVGRFADYYASYRVLGRRLLSKHPPATDMEPSGSP
ncbi:hypothetical protein FEK35_23405 [Nocardia cyriacigeorgica]|uniref:Uncharacterized protein n=1 Tax=Nocardia cyriacigeorgica TaxID=135487 RepID=A0A5R8P8I5_9NOCA|nr:hypothetical protein [Nocardia cyriacigeorgica]TLG01808.1 hypothetical protein FEK35_23405 [Nocardia cyriacigeorgica]